jgi:hypothetical protein
LTARLSTWMQHPSPKGRQPITNRRDIKFPNKIIKRNPTLGRPNLATNSTSYCFCLFLCGLFVTEVIFVYKINKFIVLIKTFTPQLAITFLHQHFLHCVAFLDKIFTTCTQCAPNFRFFSLRNLNTKLHMNFCSQLKHYGVEMFYTLPTLYPLINKRTVL